MVTTFTNVPYFFNSDDFEFLDADPGDQFTEILIVDIEQIGYLLWNGSHVEPGAVIPFDQIDKLTFTPLNDQAGSPYDAFTFKVGDGQSYSSENYTMTINVEDPNSVSDNELNNFVSIYPVPADAYTTLTIHSEKSLETLSLRVFSTNGQLMYQNTYDYLSNEFQQTLDISMLPIGAYFVVGRSPIGQFVKQIQVKR